MNAQTIRVLLVDAQEVVRCGIRSLFAPEGDIRVVGEANTAAECHATLPSADAQVAVLEIDLPDRSGLELLSEIKTLHPRLKVLMLSTHAETQSGVRCFKLGADGYLSKAGPADRIPAAIRKVASGGKYLSAALAEALAASIDDPRSIPPQDRLSPRELDVFLRIARGQSLTSIGRDLGLSVKTIGTYRARVLEKTACHNNADLTRLALAHDMMHRYS